MVAPAAFIEGRPDLPGQPNTPPGADYPVYDVHPVIEGDPDWIAPVEE